MVWNREEGKEEEKSGGQVERKVLRMKKIRGRKSGGGRERGR